MKINLPSAPKQNDRRSFLARVITGAGAVSLASSAGADYAAARNHHKRSMTENEQEARPFGFVVHGGAGVITRSLLSPADEKLYRSALTAALDAGHRILRDGGHGLDAIVAAIKILEDNPLFNAGKGAVFTSAGTNELDASIMDGGTLKAGAVSTLKHIKNPITLARLVMEKSPHVMMVGEGAEAFARQHKIEMVPQSYFYTEKRWQALQKIKREEAQKESDATKDRQKKTPVKRAADDRHGTVGAVALDRAGNLSAGTSTGGMTNKRFGRVGDSPIIGAGTYADNATCAVSATGDGEYFIRSVVAHDISAMVAYGGLTLSQAAQNAIDKVGRLGGEGGVIAIDKNGNIAMPFNSEGMYRGSINRDGRIEIKIYKE